NQWEHGGDPEYYRLPDTTGDAIRLVDELPVRERDILAMLITPDGKRARLSALVRVMDGEDLIRILRTSQQALAGAPTGYTGYHTGIVLQLVQAQIALVQTQLKSLGLALLVVFICIFIGLRSLRLLLFSVLPNLFPILVLFGFMGLAAVPLDPATVMVAAMALGIAVDDTMHLLCTWQERLTEAGDSVSAMREAVLLNTPAMIATTTTACVGFLALSLSTFGPIRFFGLLSGGAMVVALLADLWLLPALVVQFTKKKAGPS
ncbi:MAG: MMPL family transporter, partial [Candidatus Hydrogenedentes bacterium]|nr:MMPL family transporter [Candidatus Hydrogenedentota bacterium]